MTGEILQPWVKELPLMQQTVLLTALRGPDGVRKNDSSKDVVRVLRRLVLISAKAGRSLSLSEEGGGEFMPPIIRSLSDIFNDFVYSHDHLSYHFVLHITHAFEIVGYKYPVGADNIQFLCHRFYYDMCDCFHMNIETEEQMDRRLKY